MSSPKPQRSVPATVQLSPTFLKSFPVAAPAAESSTGLLFGVISGSNITLQTFQPVMPTAWQQSPPLLAPGSGLLGWYSFATHTGLTPNDCARHNRHFRRVSDIVLLLKSGPDATARASLYACSQSAPLTPDNCLSDTLLLSKSADATQSLTFVPAKLDPIPYLRAYEVPDPPALPQRARPIPWLLLAAILAGLTLGLVVGTSLHLTLPSALANYLHSF